MAKPSTQPLNDPATFQLFNEIGIIQQLVNTRFERALPDGLTASQFGVLNHFVRLGGERAPSDLGRNGRGGAGRTGPGRADADTRRGGDRLRVAARRRDARGPAHAVDPQ